MRTLGILVLSLSVILVFGARIYSRRKTERAYQTLENLFYRISFRLAFDVPEWQRLLTELRAEKEFGKLTFLCILDHAQNPEVDPLELWQRETARYADENRLSPEYKGLLSGFAEYYFYAPGEQIKKQCLLLTNEAEKAYFLQKQKNDKSRPLLCWSGVLSGVLVLLTLL